MNKEEILARSRAERKDEGEEFALGKGRLYGEAAMTLMYLALLVFNWVYDRDNSMLFALYWMYLAFELIGRYRVKHQKKLLVGAIISIIASVGFTIGYVVSVVR